MRLPGLGQLRCERKCEPGGGGQVGARGRRGARAGAGALRLRGRRGTPAEPARASVMVSAGGGSGNFPRGEAGGSGGDGRGAGGSSVSVPAAARTAAGSPALEGVPRRAVPLPFPVPLARGLPEPPLRLAVTCGESLPGAGRAAGAAGLIRAGGREMRSDDICRRGWEILISLVRFACG